MCVYHGLYELFSFLIENYIFRDAADLTQRRSRKEGNEYKLRNCRTHLSNSMPGTQKCNGVCGRFLSVYDVYNEYVNRNIDICLFLYGCVGIYFCES